MVSMWYEIKTIFVSGENSFAKMLLKNYCIERIKSKYEIVGPMSRDGDDRIDSRRAIRWTNDAKADANDDPWRFSGIFNA